MLSHRIAIIVPSTINANETAPVGLISEWIQAAKVKFARLFGGFISYNAMGGYVSDEYGLIEEAVTVISSYTDEDGLNFVQDVKEFAAKMAFALSQEVVSMEVDHQLDFIAPQRIAA